MITLDMRLNADLSPETIAERFNLEPGGAAQRMLTFATMYYMVDYWAYDTGRLANSPYYASNYDTGEIVYDTPYASEMYYGVREDGRTFNYHLDKNPLAGPFPLERMLADHKDDIVEEVRRVAGGK